MSEFKRFVNSYFRVAFCFFLGDSLLQIGSIIIDYVTGTQLNNAMNGTKAGLIIQLFFCLFGLTWIIRDGEFLADIKASHWSQKTEAND